MLDPGFYRTPKVCSGSAIAAPRSASKGRYAVHSGQSTWADLRRPLVSPGLWPPKALVGHNQTVGNGSFGAA